MAAGLLDETKSVLKSLIISCPHGMTIDRLNKDYREWEGRAIPFADLGYNKLETFLRSLSDTLVVTGSGFNATITAIASQKSAHIDKMVSIQKNSTRRRSRLKSPPGYGRRTPPTNKSPRNITPQNITPQNITPQMHQNWQANKPKSPQYFPMQQPIQSLMQQPIQSLMQQRNILQNGVLQQQQQIQQILQQNLMQGVYRLQASQNAYSYNNLMHHPLLAQPQKPFDQQPQYFNYNQYQNIPILNRLDNINLNTSNPTKSQEAANLNRMVNVEPNLTNIRSPSNLSNKLNDSGKGTSPESNETNANMQKFADSPIRGENFSFEPEPVNEKYNGDITSSSSISGSIGKTTDLDQSTFNTISKSEASTSKGNFNNNPLGDTSQVDLLELEEKLGEINISSKLVSRKRKLNKNVIEAVPELQKNDFVFQLDFPVDTVKYGETIPESEIPENLVEANWFGVFIAEVHNPYKFWFHLYKENHELDNMMNHIENIYVKLPQQELQLHRSGFKPGQICCALFSGLWHRAEILEVPEGSTVKLLFVDYGTVASVALNEVKFLLTEFSTLPCQALRGCLAQVKPIDHRWDRDATYAFLSMVQSLFLYAKATEVDYKEKVVKMILTDTNNKSDFQINEALIRKGHARYISPIQSNSSESQHVSNERRKHFQELYPTFEMLEKGEYPSLNEISILRSKGIDFEALQDENIIPYIDGGHSIEEISRKLTNRRTLKINNSTMDHQNRPDVIPNGNRNVKQPVDLVLSNTSDNGISSASSMSDNLNPFYTEVTNDSNIRYNDTRNVQKHFNSTNAHDSIPKKHASNPFLSDSDSDLEQDKISFNPMNRQYASSFQHFGVPQQVNNAHKIIRQMHQIRYDYMPPPPMPTNQNVNYFPIMNNTPYNGYPIVMSEISTPRVSRPPPGFENFIPKSRNAFQ